MLFLVPFGILGTAIPFALRLRAQSLEEIGRAAGNLGAASALASVIAALCTGYVLIPNLGVSSITAAIGILLVLIGIPGLFRRWRGASL
jgi:predicted membrane-bound spermidine synthase